MSSLFYLLLLLPATTICGSSKKFLDLFPADYDRRTAPPLINEGKNKTTFLIRKIQLLKSIFDYIAVFCTVYENSEKVAFFNCF